MSGVLPSFRHFVEKTAASKREAPRHRAHSLTCNLGDLVDLSTSGMRVRCRRAPEANGRVDVVLIDYTRPGELAADVVWVKPAGSFHFEVGLKFRKMSREMSSRLGSIALSHRFRRAV